MSALAADGTILASVRLAVSDTPVCVESLDAVALTEVAIAAADAASSLPSAGNNLRLRFTPMQVSIALANRCGCHAKEGVCTYIRRSACPPF